MSGDRHGPLASIGCRHRGFLGIGLELAKLCAQNGFDLVVAADEPQIHDAAEKLTGLGAEVVAVEADLATLQGVDELHEPILATGRPVDALFANAGRGLGRGFLDQDVDEFTSVVDTNITPTRST